MSRVKHDLICAYNTLKDLKDTSIRFFEAHCTTEILHNESISEAALAKDRLGGSEGDKTEIIRRQREIADHQSNEEMQGRVKISEEDFAHVGERIMAILTALGVSLSGGVCTDRVKVVDQALAEGGQDGERGGANLGPLERARLRNMVRWGGWAPGL